MKYFSLFSGIGGFELGIQRSQTKSKDSSNSEGRTPQLLGRSFCVGFSEIDKYAIQIYKKHFPTHKEYGDVTNIKWSDVPDFELLVAGFPCQSFSTAGRRKGFNDIRGTLFFEIARVTQEKQPRLLLLENVKGLLSHDKGHTFGTILNTLDELGYDLQWQVLNSKNFGVPQNRERVFIIGHLRTTSRPQVFPLRQTNEIYPENSSRKIAKCLDSNYHKGWLDHGQRTMVALTEQRTDKARSIRREMMKKGRDWCPRRGKILVPRTDNIGNCVTSGSSKEHLVVYGTSQDQKISRNISQSLNAGHFNQPKTQDGCRIRRLTPTECERLQGFPDGWTEGISDTQRYKCLGNAVTVNVISAIMEKLLDFPRRIC